MDLDETTYVEFDEMISTLRAARGDPALLSLATINLLLAEHSEVEIKNLRTALEVASVPHWFDEEVLGALLDPPLAALAPLLTAQLRCLSVVEPFPARGPGAANVHEAARLAIRDRLKNENPHRLSALSTQAQAYFENHAPHLRIEALYHLCAAQPTIAQKECAALSREWNSEGRHEELLALRVMLEELAPKENGVPPTERPFFDHVITDLRPAVPPDAKSGVVPVLAEIPAWKRALDHVIIWLSLPLWAPLMILIAIWIKIRSPGGDICFRQERVGFRGRRFMILKFRTMKTNDETQSHERHLERLIHGNHPMTRVDAARDPRIIPWGGRFLRASGLDELPQILNVLWGEMSLVGPRPCTPSEFRRYQVWQQERVNAPPGLTGYWQVNGKNKTTFTEMIQMDIFYTRNMSLWLDLTIMVKTFPAILTQLIESRTVRHRLDGSEESASESPISHKPL